MPSTMIPPPVFDLTVRVGCSLAYEVTGTASLLLNLQPLPNRNHAVIFEPPFLDNGITYIHYPLHPCFFRNLYHIRCYPRRI